MKHETSPSNFGMLWMCSETPITALCNRHTAREYSGNSLFGVFLAHFWCLTYLILGFLGAPGEIAELELDGSGLGGADFYERTPAGLQVDPGTRNLSGSAETRVQVLS